MVEVAVVVVVLVVLLFLWLLSFFCFFFFFLPFSLVSTIPLKHVAASTAVRFNFSFADGCFNVCSPSSPTCPSAIQLTSGECPVYDSTFSSSLSSRSAGKTQVRSRKKTSERKKTRLAAGKKRLAAGKSCFRSGKKRQQKMPLRSGKNSKQQKKHLAAAQKHLCSRKNTFWRQREKTVRGGKKPVRGKKKTGRGRNKSSSRESPALQPKKLPQRKKYISATGKSSSPKKKSILRLHSLTAA